MNVSAVVDSGKAVATILWEPTPSAVDNIDTIDPASIICVDNSGSIVMSGDQYPANLTTVTCQVNDTQQNEGSCSFTIAVSGKYEQIIEVLAAFLFLLLKFVHQYYVF